MKSEVHICFRTRSSTVSTFIVSAKTSRITRLVAACVLDGTTVDCASNSINGVFLDTLKKRITAVAPLTRPRHGVPRPPVELNIDDTLQYMADRNIVYNIPLNLLHGYHVEDAAYTTCAEMFDVHERLLFQVFNSWDNYDQEVRVFMMGRVCATRNASAELRQQVLKLAAFSKLDLLLMLFKHRGLYFRDSHVQPHSCETMERANYVVTSGRPRHRNVVTSHVKTTCPCARGFYLSRVYGQVLESEEGVLFDTGPNMSAEARCSAFTHLLVTALSYMWEAILVALTPIVIPLPQMRNCRVVLYHTKPFSTVFAFARLPLEKNTGLFETTCNHAPLCALIRKTVMINKNYGSFCVPSNEESFFSAAFDNDTMPLCNYVDDCVLLKIEALEQALSIASIEKRYANKISSLIDVHFPDVAAIKDVGAKIKWLAFEFIYQTLFNTTMVLSDTRIETNAHVERYNLTFGLITQRDTTWIENYMKISTFVLELRNTVADIRVLMLQELLAEETKKDEKRAALERERRKVTIAARVVAKPMTDPVCVPALVCATCDANETDIRFEQYMSDIDTDSDTDTCLEVGNDFCMLDVDEIIREFRCSPDDAIVTTPPRNQLPIGHGRTKCK